MASETGATPEQVNNAIRRHCAKLWALGGQPPPSDERIASWLNRTQYDDIHYSVDYWAAHLVPPGAVLLDPEAATALRRDVETVINFHPMCGYPRFVEQAMERIRAALEGSR